MSMTFRPAVGRPSVGGGETTGLRAAVSLPARPCKLHKDTESAPRPWASLHPDSEEEEPRAPPNSGGSGAVDAAESRTLSGFQKLRAAAVQVQEESCSPIPRALDKILARDSCKLLETPCLRKF